MLQQFIELDKQHRQAYADMEDVLTGANITPKEFVTLSLLDGMSIKAIAKRLGVTLPQITLYANRLEQHGYITRQYSKEDKRYRYCYLTNKGRRLLTKLNADG